MERKIRWRPDGCIVGSRRGPWLLRFQFPTPTGAAVHVARQEKHLKRGVRSQVSGVQAHPTRQAQREKSPAQMQA